MNIYLDWHKEPTVTGMHISVTPPTIKAAWDANIVADNNIHFGFLVGDATGTPTQGDPSCNNC